MQDSQGLSQAKIILVGEHAVVYGSPAIALPIPAIQVSVSLKPRTDRAQRISSQVFSGELADSNRAFFAMADLIRSLLRRFDASTQGFDCVIKSELPAERGMGSSAATATAIVRAFFKAFGAPLTPEVLRDYVDSSEHALHGNPSGLDAATAASAHPIAFKRGEAPRTIKFPNDGALVIADTGVASETKTTVRAVADLKEADPKRVDSLIEKIGASVEQAEKALIEDDLQTLGLSMNAAQVALDALGVSTDALDKLVEASREAGALGAKLTGGGGGGCMIALASDPEAGRKIAKALKVAGATAVWQYNF